MYTYLPAPRPVAPNIESRARDFGFTVFNACTAHLGGHPSMVHLPADVPATLAVPFWAAVAAEMTGTGWRLAGDEPLYRVVVLA